MRLAKFLRLPRSEQTLLVLALGEVVFARIALTCLPFPRVRSRNVTPSLLCRHSPERIGWAIQIASRFVPRATCLTQALAAERLLARHGYECELRVGVAKRDDRLNAHAWIERDGEILLGELSAEAFTPLR